MFASWGGAYQAAQRQAYIEPFKSQFGIDVIEESVRTGTETKAMVTSGDVQWHVLDRGTGDSWQLAQSGYLEDLDFSIIDTRQFLDSAKSAWFGGGGVTRSTVLAYNTNSYPSGLQDMSAYYDMGRYPGRRGWAYYDDSEIVFALLGEDPSLLGTVEGRSSLSSLTVAQLEHSYELMNQYEDQFSRVLQNVWECPQLLVARELDMCTTQNSRIFDVQQEGAPIAICWQCGHLLATNVWSIPKGLATQNPDKFYLAQLFMAWTSFPEINVNISKYIAYGPINLKSLPYLDGPEFGAMRHNIPSSSVNLQYAILKDEKWATETADARYERYLEWQANL